MKTVIIDYGAGNVQSVKFALKRLGIDAVLSHNEEEIRKADKVIFPGVGEAASAMQAIRKHKLEEVIPDLRQPTLGICLGLQLMCEHSSERDTDCLGIFPGVKVDRFPRTEGVKIPHMGWNQLTELKHPLLADVSIGDYSYFVHSYYAPVNEFTIGTCNYIIDFSAVMAKDNFHACQFHPEKSADVGHQILKNFIGKR